MTEETQKRIKETIVNTNIHQKDMEFIVEKYIEIRKGISVDINLTKGYGQYFPEVQIARLIDGFNIACQWLCRNEDKWLTTKP